MALFLFVTQPLFVLYREYATYKGEKWLWFFWVGMRKLPSKLGLACLFQPTTLPRTLR